MSSELTPDELVELLNDLYMRFDALVDKHSLYKVETIGDAFMCVGGAPEPCHPRDAAIRVARMALDMIACASEVKLPHDRKLQIR
jgi:class 3 adenylate cyclase